MIQASKAGFLFKSTDAIKAEYPEIPAYETYDELYDAIKKVIEVNPPITFLIPVYEPVMHIPLLFASVRCAILFQQSVPVR